MRLDPNILNVIGLMFGIIGGLWLAIDALAPDSLIEALEDTKNHRRQLTSVSFIFAMRTIFSVLIISSMGAFILSKCVSCDLVTSASYAVLTYPVWTLSSKAVNFAFTLLLKLSPAKNFASSTAIGKIVRLLLILPWFLALTFVFILLQIFHYVISKPIEIFSTYILSALVFRLLTSAAQTSKIEKEYSFRRKAFFGVMLMCVGFFYQLLATVIMTSASHP